MPQCSSIAKSTGNQCKKNGIYKSVSDEKFHCKLHKPEEIIDDKETGSIGTTKENVPLYNEKIIDKETGSIGATKKNVPLYNEEIINKKPKCSSITYSTGVQCKLNGIYKGKIEGTFHCSVHKPKVNHVAYKHDLKDDYTDEYQETNENLYDGPKIQDPFAIGEDKIYAEKMKPYLFGSIIHEKSTYCNHYKEIHRTESIYHGNKRTSRLNKELRFLKNNLPLHFNSSIALKINDTHPSLMTAIIFAPNNTPYDSGCFVFDIHIPSNYPDVPPLVHLTTTGAGQVRFSPNLYDTGKVCLSLLGTWRGMNPTEMWTTKSNVWQVLISIQSAILGSEFPYFDEPGAEKEIGTKDGNYKKRVALNGGYEKLREHTIKFAIIEQIQNPHPEFKDIIHEHFRIKRDYINGIAIKWLYEAETSDNSTHYYKMLDLINKLHECLFNLN